jgi:hypothetical protein
MVMRNGLLALILVFSAATCAFTNEIAEIIDSSRITYSAPYSLKVNGSVVEIKFTENKSNLSMILSDQTGNVIFSKDTVLPDQMNSISIPLADTSKPMTLDIRCAAFTGKTFIPGNTK